MVGYGDVSFLNVVVEMLNSCSFLVIDVKLEYPVGKHALIAAQ